MFKIVTSLIPIFVVMALGYWMTRRAYFSREHLMGFGRFVISVALPALIFKTLASHSITEIFIAPYLWGYGLATLLVFFISAFIAFLRKQGAVAMWLDGIAASYSNSVFVGFPLIVSVIGSAGDLYISLNVLVECLLLIPLFLVLMECAQAMAKGTRPKILPLLSNMLRKPLILSLFFGLLFSAFQWKLPLPLNRVIDILSNGASAAALLIIGGGLYGISLKGSLSDILQITTFKLVLMPLLCAFCIWLFGGSSEMIFVGALLGGVPLANTSVLFCQQYGHIHRGTASMLLSTVLSTLTLSFIFLLHEWGL